MSQTTLLLSMLGTVATASLYLYVGQALHRRKVSPEGHLANAMFVLWWRSLGGLSLLSAGALALYMADRFPIWLYQAYVICVLLVIFLALWGLQFYLVYLYTGSRRSFVPLGLFYLALFIAVVGLIEYVGTPERITDNGWSLRTEPRVEFGTWFNVAFSVLLVGPQLVAAVAYARLYRKTDDRTQRYRIALVTGSIIVWFGTSLVASAFDASDNVTWQMASRVLSVIAVLVILMAYKPPSWVRERYGIRPIELASEAPAAAAPPSL